MGNPKKIKRDARDEFSNSNYGEYFNEGEKGEQLFTEAKKICDKTPQVCIEQYQTLLAKENCESQEYSENGIEACKNGVSNKRKGLI